MSLILEALKKSEAERQSRKMPGLLTPSPKRRRRGGGLWLAAFVLLLTAVGGGWWLGQRGSEMTAPIALETPAQAPTTAPVAAQPTEPDPVEQERAPLPAASAPDTTERRQVAEDARPASLTARAPRESAAMVAPTSPDPLTDPDLDDDSRARLTEVLSTLPDPPRSESRPAQPPPTSRQVVGATEPTRTVTSRELDPPGKPHLHELPFTLRRDIPPIRVSMMVSSGDASARFALINGERRHEGDEVAPGVRLHEIGPQTLELEFRGQRFLLRQGAL